MMVMVASNGHALVATIQILVVQAIAWIVDIVVLREVVVAAITTVVAPANVLFMVNNHASTVSVL
jgi:hypothetical protein